MPAARVLRWWALLLYPLAARALSTLAAQDALGTGFGAAGLHSATRAAESAPWLLELDGQEAAEMLVSRARFEAAHGRLTRRLSGGTSPAPPVAKGREKKVLHMHVHNSAGSFLCAVAWRLGGESCRRGLLNCNLARGLFDDGPFTEAGKSNRTCEDRRTEMDVQQVTFSMLERWIDQDAGDWCPNDFVYTIIMRDPIARARTTIRMNLEGKEERVFGWLTESNPAQRHGWLSSYAAYNDLVVRLLNGPEVMLMPRGALNASHLERAKQRLQDFDVVMTIPSLPSDWWQLVDKLGWRPTPNPFDAPVMIARPPLQASSQLQTLLEEHNKLDLELYAFAVQLAEARTRAAMQRLGTVRGGPRPAEGVDGGG